jgi:gamma-glutamyltranspeptidase/glutathione hydrolase
MKQIKGSSRFRPAKLKILSVMLLAGLAACQMTHLPHAVAPNAPVAGVGRIGAVPVPAGWDGGFVATSSARPAEAAARVLAGGGNAIDAAAVALFMLNVVEPQSSGIGGGGFMMIHLAEQRRTVVIDSRETAPAAADPRMFIVMDGTPMPYALASTSGVSVGVPGALRGIELALARWGTITLADALAPAIAAAQNGIVVGQRLAEILRSQRLQSDCGVEAYDEARSVFRPGEDDAEEDTACGRSPDVGTMLTQPDLARTFRLIARRGASVLYDCEDPSGLARALIATQHAGRAELGRRGQGRMTCEDLATYRPIIRDPVETTYRGWIIRSAPPPSSGGLTLIQMLKMLERFPLSDAEAGFGDGSFATLNLLQEAMRLAFADRSIWMGDTDVLPELPVRGLIDDRYLARRSASCPDDDPTDDAYCIVPGERITVVRPGDPRPYNAGFAGAGIGLAAAGSDQEEGRETTHFTIADRWGNIVSCTTTVEAPWGTGLMVPGFGFLLNNELTDFNLSPRQRGVPGDPDWDPGANDVAPGKRPRSSMTPLVVFAPGNDEPRPAAAYGSPGGSTIINTVLDVSLALIDFDMSVRQAVERPRLSLTSPAEEARTGIESGFRAEVLRRLTDLGYHFSSQPSDIGAVQALVVDRRTGLVDGYADPRRDGRSIGLSSP